MSDRFDRWFRPEEFARRQIDDEIAAHLAARHAHLVAQGFGDEEARLEAIRRFGDVRTARAALLERARARHRRIAWRDRLEQVRQDFRFVWRGLWRQPAFTLGVTVTLALGLGINAAVFRVADQVLVRPPAGVSRPHEIRRVEAMVTLGGGSPQRATIFSYPDAVRVIDGQVFERAATYSLPRIQADESGRELGVSHVDAGYFELLGVHPHLGRFFDAAETRPGTMPSVAVVSRDYWVGSLGARPMEGGLSVRLGARTYRVVGIAPRHFTGIEADPAAIWLPLGDAEFGRGSINGVAFPWYRADMMRALRIVGRLGPSGEDATRQRLTAALAMPEAPFSMSKRDGALSTIVPVGDNARAASVNAMLVRLGAVAAVVLMIACGNAINLLLARGLRRSREVAIRVAVGASRWRVARLLLAESVVLAAIGGLAATLCGLWTAEALRRLIFPDSRWTADAIDLRTLLFTGGIAALAGLVAGIVPAVQATRTGCITALKEARSPGGRAGRTQAALIVVQTALSIALLVGCGLLVGSLARLNAVDLGFDPAGLVLWSSGRSELPASRVAELSERVRALPGVRGAALTSIAPFGATAMIDITVPGSSFVPESAHDNPLYMAVSPEFFSTMGMRVLRGRALSADDAAGADPVAVVNEAMARRFWGTASPFESCIIAPPNPCARVVGVVTDVSDTPGAAAAPMRFYLPLAQSASDAQAIIVLTDAAGVPALVAQIRALVQTARPPTIDIVADGISRALHPWRTAAWLFTALGAIALILACVGIYSVMSYLVAERMHEMGLRLALGATAGGIVGLVLRTGLRLIGLGAALGLAVAAAFGNLLESLLYQVSAREPLVYGLAALALLALGTASMLPAALKAGRADPLETLRAE